MTKRRVVRRSTSPVKPPVEEAEAEVLEEAEAEVLEETPPPAPRKRGRPRKATKPKKPAPKPKPESEPEPEPAKSGAPRRTRTRRTTRTKPASEAPEATESAVTEEPVEEPVINVGSASPAGMMDILIRLLDADKTIVLSKLNQKYIMTSGTAPEVQVAEKPVEAKPKPVMTIKEMEDIALTEDYKEWRPWWSGDKSADPPTSGLTFEEKVAEAKEADAVWEEIDNPLAHNLRVTMAYLKAMEIEKWKPEYSTRKARDQLKFGQVEAE